jgi:hypothetical protein
VLRDDKSRKSKVEETASAADTTSAPSSSSLTILLRTRREDQGLFTDDLNDHHQIDSDLRS